MQQELVWIRSYVIDETHGDVGAICVYEASSPEAIRRHAEASGLPIDEIARIADTMVLRPDSVPLAVPKEER
jgi:hypothetical protein